MTNNNELKKMRQDAEKTVAGFVATATASCAVPIPIADSVVLIGEQVAMMVAISSIYKLGLSKKTLQTLLMGTLGASGMSVVGRAFVGSAFKLMPGIGTVAGSVISASTAGALTYTLGNAFLELCEAVKKGELTESDLLEKTGREYFKDLINIWSKKDETQKEYEDILEKFENKEEMPYIERVIEMSEIEISGLAKLNNVEPRTNWSCSIHYSGEPIGYIEGVSSKECKLIIKEIQVKPDFREKGIETEVWKRVSDLFEVEVSVKETNEEA